MTTSKSRKGMLKPQACALKATVVENMKQSSAAMDSCFGLVPRHQRGIAGRVPG